MPTAWSTRINLNESQVHADLTAQMNVKLITEG